MYLARLGYKGLSIVDGSGDGGRDVICDRDNLRIQLSVRKDWPIKINEEAGKTAQAGLSHMIYVTNRIISPSAETDFFQTKYSYGGIVETSLHDLRKISTALAQPGVIQSAYEMLGMKVPANVEATTQEIAISTLLLFSDEARDLRENVIGANLRAQLLKKPNVSENALIYGVLDALPGVNVDRAAKSALSRLRSAGLIEGPTTALRLGDKERLSMEAAETEFLAAVTADVKMLEVATGLPSDKVRRLLDIALELLVRSKDLDGPGPVEEELRIFMAENKLNRKREAVYDALSRTAAARFKQHGAVIHQIFSANTFDVYRALGRRTQVSLVLDSSVAMPVLFGLEFGAAKSRYGIAALALRDACKAHNIKMVVPQCYLNEMAAHGRVALEKVDVYNALPAEARTALRASGNAYLSHYTHVSETTELSGQHLTLDAFLRHFGVIAGVSLGRIENRIRTLLELHDIEILPDQRYDQDVRNRIIEEKQGEQIRTLIDHDAIVCTMLRNDHERGYVFATWDKALIGVVEDIARVVADTPARVIDFLSMASGQSFECEQSFELLSTLLHADDKVAQKLADKVDQIKSTELSFQLGQFIDAARKSKGGSWTLEPDDVASFLEQHPVTP